MRFICDTLGPSTLRVWSIIDIAQSRIDWSDNIRIFLFIYNDVKERNGGGREMVCYRAHRRTAAWLIIYTAPGAKQNVSLSRESSILSRSEDTEDTKSFRIRDESSLASLQMRGIERESRGRHDAVA